MNTDFRASPYQLLLDENQVISTGKAYLSMVDIMSRMNIISFSVIELSDEISLVNKTISLKVSDKYMNNVQILLNYKIYVPRNYNPYS